MHILLLRSPELQHARSQSSNRFEFQRRVVSSTALVGARVRHGCAYPLSLSKLRCMKF
jgi:hypothetical protein